MKTWIVYSNMYYWLNFGDLMTFSRLKKESRLIIILLLIFALFITPVLVSAASYDLSGVWDCDDNGRYYIVQIGSDIYWYGELDTVNPGWSNVAVGTIDGDTISLKWADVPKGKVKQNGVLILKLTESQSPDNLQILTVVNKTGNFGGSKWTRTNAAIINPDLTPTLTPNATITPTPSATQGPYPDLKPVKIETQKGDSANPGIAVSIEVENIGSADADPSKGQLEKVWMSCVAESSEGYKSVTGSSDFTYFDIPAIKKGEKTTVSTKVNSPQEPGKLTLTATVNYLGTIKESDYRNNVIVSSVIPVSSCPPEITYEDKIADAIFTETNAIRSKNGLSPLKRNKNIDAITMSQSKHVASKGTADHENFDSRSSQMSNLGFKITGENVAPFRPGNQLDYCDQKLHNVADTPEGLAKFVIDVLVNHDSCNQNGHRNNILDNKYTDIGISVVKGVTFYFVTQDFAG